MIPVPWYIRFAPHIGAALLLGLAVWFIDHRGYQRAETQNQLAEARDTINRQALATAIGDQMGKALVHIDQQLADSVGHIQTVDRTIIQPTLMKELTREKRFSDPALGISDGVRGAINQARALSCTTAVDGSVACPLSPAQPAPGQ